MSQLIERLVDLLRERGARVEFGMPADRLDPSVPTIVATDAQSAARLVEPHAPRLGAALGAIDMTSLAMTTVVFSARAADLRGFGVLFPRGTGIEALGARFDSDIFPAPENRWRVETWISALDPDRIPDADALWRATRADRRALTGRDDTPAAVVSTVRPRALPLYGGAVLEVRQHLGELPPWLALTGNYLGRIGAARLLDAAADAAARIGLSIQCRNRSTRGPLG
jgi:protoporphyrinogen oxidase